MDDVVIIVDHQLWEQLCQIFMREHPVDARRNALALRVLGIRSSIASLYCRSFRLFLPG
jgi:hypothetical protein